MYELYVWTIEVDFGHLYVMSILIMYLLSEEVQDGKYTLSSRWTPK